MAEPARNLRPENRPDIPGLRALEGGGEGDGQPRGKLRDVNDDQGGLFNQEGDRNVDEVRQKEEQPKSQDTQSDGQDNASDDESEDDDAGQGGKFNPNGDKRRRLRGFTRRRVALGAGITSAVVVGAFGFSVIQGPASIVNLGELLKRPLATQDDSSVQRLHGFFRYSRGGEFGETRISWLGSQSVAKTTARLKELGIEIRSSSPLGTPDSIRIAADSPILEGKTGVEAAESLLEKYKDAGATDERLGIDAKAGAGKEGVEIKVRGKDGLFRAVYYDLLREAYKDTVWGDRLVALKARAPMNYYGNYRLLLNPFKRTELKSQEASIRFVQERNKFIKRRSAAASARVNALKEKLQPYKGTIVTGAGAVNGVQLGVCVAKEIAHEVPLTNYENASSMAEAGAIDAIALGEGIKDGSLHQSEAGAIYTNFTDDKGDTIWASAGLKALSGQKGGIDVDKDTKQAFSPDTSSAAKIEQGLNAAGGAALCSTAGIAAGFGLGALAIVLAVPSGGTSVVAYGAAVGTGLAVSTAVVGALTHYMPQLLADDPLNYVPHSGPLGGTMDAFGSREFAGDTFRKSGGVELSNSQSTELEIVINKKDREEFQSKSLMSRLFDTHDYRSAISQVAMATPSNHSQLISDVSHFSFIKSFGDIVSSILPKTYAADSGRYDWGFPEYGFSKEEMDNPLFQDPYDNAEKAAGIFDTEEDNDNPHKYFERARNCFGVNINKGEHGWEVEVAKISKENPDDQVIPSTVKYQSANCKDQSTDWLRIRFFIFDSRTMDAYACYEDDHDSCLQLGLDDSGSDDISDTATEGAATESVNVADLGKSSSSMHCAQGTKDLGVATSKYNGEFKKESGPMKIRLCQITDIPGQGNDKNGNSISGGAVVEARVSGAWRALAKKAKADGVNLTSSSSFRLADSCGGTGDGIRCAKPGGSAHQTGWAIDFNNMGGFSPTGDSRSCSGRMTYSSKEWKWMREHSEDFGIKQYSAESWHWDFIPSDNRCGK